jgi:hypothetical protein
MKSKPKPTIDIPGVISSLPSMSLVYGGSPGAPAIEAERAPSRPRPNPLPAAPPALPARSATPIRALADEAAPNPIVDAANVAADNRLPRGFSFPSDPVERLPPAARAKMQAIRAADEDIGVLLLSLSERRTEATRARTAAGIRVASLTEDMAASRAGTEIVAADHPSVVSAQAALEGAQRVRIPRSGLHVRWSKPRHDLLGVEMERRV